MKRAFSTISSASVLTDKETASSAPIEPTHVHPPAIGPRPDLKPEPLPVDDPTLDIVHMKQFLDSDAQKTLRKTILDELGWFRVRYLSNRFGTECETPCWSNCFGGFPEFEPYQPIPSALQPLQAQLENFLGTKFNIVLMRLYFDGEDNIAWHTDGREFLGRETVVASISLGASRKFEMKRPHELWPEIKCAGRSKIQTNPAAKKLKETIYQWNLSSGDLFVMKGKTQQFWQHRVPQETKKRGSNFARININFRYVNAEDAELAERGHKTYYKYTAHGDAQFNSEFAKFYVDIVNDWKVKRDEVQKVKGNTSIVDFFKKQTGSKPP